MPGERVQFAGVMAALGLCVLWLVEASGIPPVATLALMLVLSGAAFAPTRWRGVGPLSGIATAVVAGEMALGAILAGRGGLLVRPLGEIGSLLLGLYLFNFVCLSAGFALFGVIRSIWNRRA